MSVAKSIIQQATVILLLTLFSSRSGSAADYFTPYGPTQTERENVFKFSEKPGIRFIGNDKYEITFAVERFCDATVALVESNGQIARHLGSGVLGKNAPLPFQKNARKQKIIWNGKDDSAKYHKNPGSLRVRVSLGLKPEFDKLINWHPHNFSGIYRAVGVDRTGVYVLTGQHMQLRRFDHDGNYLATISPPPATLPADKQKGRQLLNYAKGKGAVHSTFRHGYTSTVSGYAKFLPGADSHTQQVALFDGWWVHCNNMQQDAVWLFRMRLKDGASDDVSYRWKRLSRVNKEGRAFADFGRYTNLKMAISPDRKWIYLSELQQDSYDPLPAIFRVSTSNREPMGLKAFIGDPKKIGRDNQHFSSPAGIACDSAGNLYVCDALNNRIQVYSEKARFLKTIEIDRPYLIRVHPKTGALYVLHAKRVNSKSFVHLTKLKSLKDAEPVQHYIFNKPQDDPGSWAREKNGRNPLLTIDAFSSPTRIWVTRNSRHLIVLDDLGKSFKLFRDFNKEVQDAGDLVGIMGGTTHAKVETDPTREQVYYRNRFVFDIKTGKRLGRIGNYGEDLVFDKKGYMHGRGKGNRPVVRFDPRQRSEKKMESRASGKTYTGISYNEIPYDYGELVQGWKGGLPNARQPGNAHFQHGLAVNMQGEIAVEIDVKYMPKDDDAMRGGFVGKYAGSNNTNTYSSFIQRFNEETKRGAIAYFIKPKPGRHTPGHTIWVFAASGELIQDNVVPGFGYVNGVGIDEERAVYTVFNYTKMVGGKPFLADQGDYIPAGKKKTVNAFTGTLMKAYLGKAEILHKSARIPMDVWPKEPMNVKDGWGQGAEWLYAGASPIVPGGCTCPNMRIFTDWQKRTFMPANYRRSIDVVDTNGNLILHIGQYGNADSGYGSKSKVKVGGDGIAMAFAPYVATTDNYITFTDIANNRVVVLKINYHAEEMASVDIKK